MYIRNIKVNDGLKSAIFKFNRVGIFQGISLPKSTHHVYGKGLAILPDIRHIKVHYGR